MVNIPALHYGDMYVLDKYSLARIQKYARIITDRLPSGGTVLDIGCYTAPLFDLLPKTIKYRGIDFDAQAIRIAQGKGAQVQKANLDEENINIQEKFDVVVVAEVLEHLKRPQDMLLNIKRLLKDDGIAIISLPNENTIYHRLMSLFGLGIDLCAFQEFKHLHLPTIRQSENFLKKEFCIIKKSYYINPSARSSRIEGIGWLFLLVPDFMWKFLSKILPGMFARGTIFTCKKING
jgi:2-polyprenyl-3-methyl-5-hydroxy-6-metoxy-1,4-benzoquinol methylase